MESGQCNVGVQHPYLQSCVSMVAAAKRGSVAGLCLAERQGFRVPINNRASAWLPQRSEEVQPGFAWRNGRGLGTESPFIRRSDK